MSGISSLQSLRDLSPVILPSLLMCDFANLESEIRRLEEAGVKALHLDVMDGDFVPNLTYGMPIVEAINRVTDLPLDVHLMIREPSRYIDAFCQAGADMITFHAEAADDACHVLRQIRDNGVASGVAINPGTPLASIEPALELCDMVLVMSVDAGFGGQSFNRVALEKLSQLRKQVGEHVVLEVDGGINRETIHACAEAGAQFYVVGSAIFGNAHYGPAIEDLRNLAIGQTGSI